MLKIPAIKQKTLVIIMWLPNNLCFLKKDYGSSGSECYNLYVRNLQYLFGFGFASKHEFQQAHG
jgi:hypothetical protein